MSFFGLLILSMAGASLLGGLVVFPFFKAPTRTWLDHPSKFRRGLFRTCLVAACWLLPFSVIWLSLGLLSNFSAVRQLLDASPQFLDQLFLFFVPLLVALLFYNLIAAGARSRETSR
jgi:hypothetical protein